MRFVMKNLLFFVIFFCFYNAYSMQKIKQISPSYSAKIITNYPLYAQYIIFMCKHHKKILFSYYEVISNNTSIHGNSNSDYAQITNTILPNTLSLHPQYTLIGNDIFSVSQTNDVYNISYIADTELNNEPLDNFEIAISVNHLGCTQPVPGITSGICHLNICSISNIDEMPSSIVSIVAKEDPGCIARIGFTNFPICTDHLHPATN